ncbi:MAG: BCD family MFS transporter [Pseudomonadota bacterium]
MTEGRGYFSWPGIVRLGLVQMALGAIIILTTSTLNRVMVVELALPASIPGLLVGWHYAVQITRPRWGFGADAGGQRIIWIIGGLIVLALGAIGASASVLLAEKSLVAGLSATFLAFTFIGGGVGAAGTNLLALLAIKTKPENKAAAAAIVWIMMILGFVLTAGIAGQFLDPFTMGRLVVVTAIVGAIAVAVASLALLGMDTSRPDGENASATPAQTGTAKAFFDALGDVWSDRQTRTFTAFVFVSMLAYSAQDLILEPFAGLIHGYTPGESTKLAATQNMGVLLGMIATAVIGTVVGRSRAKFMRQWTLVGCVASAAALGLLAFGAITGGGVPLKPSVFGLGLSNGMFAVAAIGSMMALASAGGDQREGTRMGVWGAAQAVAFGIGGLVGAAAVDLVRLLMNDVSFSYALVFALEGVTFLIAAWLAIRVGPTSADDQAIPMMPAESLPAE